MAITAPPPTPTRSTPPAEFPALADAWIVWWAASAPQFSALGDDVVAAAAQVEADRLLAAQAAAAAVNAPGAIATSTATRTLGVGTKTFPITSGLFAIGQDVVAAVTADGTQRMTGAVTAASEDSVTIEVPDSNHVDGAGEYSAWTLSLGVKRAASFSTATAADMWARTSSAAAATPAAIAAAAVFQAVANDATITLNLNAGQNWTISPTLSGAHTLANPTNGGVGKGGIIKAKQPALGGASMAFGSWWKRQGGAPTLTPTADAEDWILYHQVTATLILYAIIKAPA